MHPSDGKRGLALELGVYFLAAAGCVAVVLNFDFVRQTLSRTLIAELERSLPPADSRDPVDRAFEKARASSADATSSLSGAVELQADRRGHYQADVEVNGRRVSALVDTGASLIMLTYEDAQRAGVAPRDRDYTLRTQTANGIARAAPVMLDRVEVGSIRVDRVQAAVAEPGRLQVTLLGMTFLSRLRKFEIASGRLILHD